MERVTINRVEILGRVGADPRVANVGNTRIARFTVATNEHFKDRSGNLHEETTWHNIALWQGKNTPDFESIKKGTTVHIYGRIRNSKYTGIDGESKYFSEITASYVDVCRDGEPQGISPVGFR